MARRSRLISLLAVACVALFSTVATASAADPEKEDCVGEDWGANKFGLNSTPNTAGSYAELAGGTVMCGSDFTETTAYGFTGGTIILPKGIKVRCANPKNANNPTVAEYCKGQTHLPVSAYVSSVGMGIKGVSPFGGAGLTLENVPSRVYVWQTPPAKDFGGKEIVHKTWTKYTDVPLKYDSETGKLVLKYGQPQMAKNALLTQCPATAIACYQGKDFPFGTDDTSTGTSNLHIAQSSNYPGHLELVIKRPLVFSELGINYDLYYTQFGSFVGQDEDGNDPLKLCAYVDVSNTTNGKACGKPASDKSNWNFQNPAKGTYTCKAGTSQWGFRVSVQSTGWKDSIMKNPVWSAPDPWAKLWWNNTPTTGQCAEYTIN